MHKKVSFIIPAYNAEKTIGQCLESILCLETNDVETEIIVVDNNSSDRTSQIVSGFEKVKYLLEQRQGRSFARNTGADHASGELLAFVDADVILEKSWLLEHLDALVNDNIGGSQGPIVPANFDGKKSLNLYRKRSSEEGSKGSFNLLTLAVKESPMINTAACIYRKSAFLKAGKFDDNLIRHEDIDLSKRVFLSGHDLASVPRALAHVSFNGAGWFSYLRRSFEDGYTKNLYLKKWSLFLFQSVGAGKETNLYYFFDEVVLNLLRSLLKMDSYYFLKSLNSSAKALGHVFACFDKKSVSCCHITPANASGFVFEHDKVIIEFDLNNKAVKRRADLE